jgi:hypothetical protein
MVINYYTYFVISYHDVPNNCGEGDDPGHDSNESTLDMCIGKCGGGQPMLGV